MVLVGVEVRFHKLLDLCVALCVGLWPELKRSPFNSQDSCFGPATWLNDSDNGASLNHIAIGGGYQGLIGVLVITYKRAQSPPKAHFGSETLGHIVEHLLSKFDSSSSEPLTMQVLIRGRAIFSAHISVVHRSCMFHEPEEDWRVAWNSGIDAGL